MNLKEFIEVVTDGGINEAHNSPHCGFPIIINSKELDWGEISVTSEGEIHINSEEVHK